MSSNEEVKVVVIPKRGFASGRCRSLRQAHEHADSAKGHLYRQNLIEVELKP